MIVIKDMAGLFSANMAEPFMNMVKRVNRIQNSDNIREGQVIKLPAR